MKRVILRGDGSKNIGMGHLKRLLIIGEELASNGHEVQLLTKNDYSKLSFLNNKKIKITEIPNFKSLEEEITYLNNLFLLQKPDIFILDVLNYFEYKNFVKKSKERNIFLIIITDESEKMDPINADIILNGNPNQLDFNYESYSSKYLIGPQFFIMDSIYNEKNNNEPNKIVNNILLTVGGSDHHNILFKILKALDNICENKNFILVVTKASGYIDKLYEISNTMENLIDIHIDAESLSGFWEKCDIAITAGGNTLFERISTRTPGATICQLKRQMEISNYFMELGVNYNIGLGELLSEDEIARKLKYFLSNFNEHKNQFLKSKNIISGNGLNLLMSYIYSSPKLLYN